MIDLQEPIRQICEQLGVEPHQVAKLELHPTEVLAWIYRLRDGQKYLEDGEPAMYLLTRPLALVVDQREPQDAELDHGWGPM